MNAAAAPGGALASQRAARPRAAAAELPDRCEPGRPWPLGATPRDGGVNFAVWSGAAERVELCLFDARGRKELRRMRLPGRSDGVWHGFVPGLGTGVRYGLRVHGPYNPAAGQRFNPRKLLLDPCARAIDRPLGESARQFGYRLGAARQDLTMDVRDNAAAAAKGLVLAPRFDWGDDRPPATPWEDSVFYEVHVRGFTMQMPEVPESLRGTFAGLGSPAAIVHLRQLGVTAVELLPVQAFADEGRLLDLGLCNYWGYHTLGFFAPEPRYCSGPPETGPDEFRAMVRALHAAGLEVILDVVYNHTCEGNHLGPTLSFKGIDNGGYYRLAADRRCYHDSTGTGNTLDLSHPPVLRLVMDSLRYWVEEMHVDGFRFDLASTLARRADGQFDHRSPFLAAVAQDPVLRRVKLIAEPWDLGDNGYQVGGFPAGWSEWNGRYRDTVRDFWRGAEGALPEFAARLCGSADLYAPAGRAPTASVNLVTVHDGFTLSDLVSYHDKRNEANGEDNRDGESHNRSWNCGAEGPTDDPGVLALRERQRRNFLATLFVSRGVPLLLGGDEMGRTQGGNNNAYCQDNAISWFDWSPARRGDPMLAFVRGLTALRRELPALARNRWPTAEEGGPDVAWYSLWGLPMTQAEWDDRGLRCVAMVVVGTLVSDARASASVLLLFNASPQAVSFTVPAHVGLEGEWRLRLDTAAEEPLPQRGRCGVAGDIWELPPHSMVLLTQDAAPE